MNNDVGFGLLANRRSHSSKQSNTRAMFNNETKEISPVFSNLFKEGTLIPALEAIDVELPHVIPNTVKVFDKLTVCHAAPPPLK